MSATTVPAQGPTISSVNISDEDIFKHLDYSSWDKLSEYKFNED